MASPPLTQRFPGGVAEQIRQGVTGMTGVAYDQYWATGGGVWGQLAARGAYTGPTFSQYGTGGAVAQFMSGPPPVIVPTGPTGG